MKNVINKNDNEWPQESRDRKDRSIEILKQNGIPYIDDLTFMPPANEIEIVPAIIVFNRAIVVFSTILQAMANKKGDLFKYIVYLEVHGIKVETLTNDEQAIWNYQVPNEKLDVYLWRGEALWVLLWALGFVDKLDIPRKVVNQGEVSKICGEMIGLSTEAVSNLKLRSKSEIMDETDLIYRIHWACIDANNNGKEPPANLDIDVVIERHMALNWLTRYDDDWDHTRT